MEQFLFSDGLRLASFRGMKDYIIPGAEWSNSLAPLTPLAPSLPPYIYFLLFPLKLVSTPPLPPLSLRCMSLYILLLSFGTVLSSSLRLVPSCRAVTLADMDVKVFLS